MTLEEWKEAYIQRLMKVGECTRQEALDNFNTIGKPDLEDDPAGCANDEVSYWGE